MTTKNPENTLAERLKEAQRLISEAADQARQKVLQQTDNPSIRRMGDGSVKMFTMSLSDLAKPQPRAGYAHPDGGRTSTNFSPFFHDWQSQYEHVAHLLEKRQFGAVAEILENGRHSEPSDIKHFAPDVVKKLQDVLGDLRETLDGDIESNAKRIKARRPGR